MLAWNPEQIDEMSLPPCHILVQFNLNGEYSKVLLNNRCVLTGRYSKIAKNLNFSRISFLRLSRLGFISGIKKSYW